MAGITRKTDDENPPPTWIRMIAGTATAAIVGMAGGGTGGYVASQIMLERHSVKIEEIEKRSAEHRADDKEEFREVKLRLRDVEKRK